MAATTADVAGKVEQLLRAHPDALSVEWSLVPDEVEQDGNCYYIPILFPNGSPRDFMSYGFLVDVEDRAAEALGGVHIVLVPAI